MNKKCVGCGIQLQDSIPLQDGYVNNIVNDLCERCFRIRNYNSCKGSLKGNNDFLKIVQNINKSNDLVVVVNSIFNLDLLRNINEIIKGEILLVITKRDILSSSIKDNKIVSYIDSLRIKYLDLEIVSSVTNYQIEKLYEKINNYKNSKKVYMVGYTNSGKSTLINKLMMKYSNNVNLVTASMYPSTTLDEVEININDDLKLVDTPGIISAGSVFNNIMDYKKINIMQKIRPLTYQLKGNCSYLIGDMIRIDYVGGLNSMTIYLSNKIKVKKVGKNNSELLEQEGEVLALQDRNDLVMEDLCFIKMIKKCEIKVYKKILVNVYTRSNFI